MYVIMRHDEYLQLNGSFDRAIELVRLTCNRALAERMAKKLKADVLPVELLLRKKVWILDKTCRFQFERALDRATAVVATWPGWKQNILDDRSTLDVPKQPVLSEYCDCY